MYETEIIKFNTTKDITRIYHISDIHIRLQSRHKEYENIFVKLYDYLENECKIHNLGDNKSSSGVIVITGDILHSKCELTPESVEITREFFRSLSKIMPTIVICGNHDINMQNHNRKDAITPSKNGLSKSLPFSFLKKTGIYQLNNLIFSVASVFDYHIINPTEIESHLDNYPTENCKKICLYHGRVDGVLLYNGTKIEGETNKKNNKTITVSAFDGYDYGLFGDIHKHQFLNKEKTVGYAGSLIQQSHGEDIKNHGVLVWDLQNKNAYLHHLENDTSFKTLEIIDNNIVNCDCFKLQDDEECGKIDNHDDCILNKEIYLRLSHNNTANSVILNILSKLKEKHHIVEVSYQDNTTYTKDTDKLSKNIMFDITKVDYQNQLIQEILETDKKNDIRDIMIKKIKRLNEEGNKKIDKQIEYKNSGQWKLIKLEYDNLYSYGSGNVVEFHTKKGIVGLIGENEMGKSALLDIILYTLFDKFPRKGTIRDIINHRKNSFMSRITLQIGEWHYTVEKTGKRTTKGGTTTKCKFWRFHPTKNIKEDLEEDNIPKTKEAILQYVGSYDDMIQTNFSLQHNNCNFIDAENTTRKRELERILRINFVDDLIKIATSGFNDMKAIITHLNLKQPIEKVAKYKSEATKIKSEMIEIDKEYNDFNSRKLELTNDIASLRQKILPDVDSKLEEYSISEYDIENFKELECELEKEFNTANEECNNIQNFDYQTEFEKHKHWKSMKQEKLDNIDVNIEEIYEKMERIPNTPNVELEDIKTELVEKIKELETTNTKLTTAKSNSVKLDNINREILDIQQKITTVSQETIPSSFSHILEETPITDLEEKLSELQENIAEEIVENNYNNIVDAKCYKSLEHTIKEISVFNCFVEYEDSINSVIKENRVLKTKLDKLNNSKIKYEGKSSKIEKYQSRMHDLEEKISELKTTIELLEKKELIIEGNQKHEKKLLKLKETKINLQKEEDIEWKQTVINKEKLDNFRELEKKIAVYKLKQQDTIKIADLIEQKKSNDKIQCQLEELEADLEEVEEEIENISNKLNYKKMTYTTLVAEKKMMLEDITELKKCEENKEMYGYYINALKQIPYMMINKIHKVLEQKVNNFLSIIANFVIKFEVSNAKIDIYLDWPDSGGIPILLNNSCGFERFISSLAIRLALLDISQLPKANFIAIDEGWNAFDFKNITKVSPVMTFLKDKFDFVISISHLQNIRQYCDEHIQLVKDKDGFSKIVN